MKKIFYKFYLKICSQKKYINYLKKQGIKIGNDCDISKNVFFGSEPYLIEIGNNVRITRNVSFVNHDGGLWCLRNIGKLINSDKFGFIKIGNNVHIGINSIIMPNVSIGDNVIIGAGAVVTKDIPSNSVAVGVPAKVIETIDEYYKKNKDKVVFTKNMNYKEKKKFIIDNFKIIK